MRLTDEQWALLAPLLTPPEKTTKRGRPRRDDRTLLEGILWVLRTGAQWDKLPRGDDPPKSTFFLARAAPLRTLGRFARLQERNDRNVFPVVLRRLHELLEDQGLLDLREAFIDGTFSAARKGARTPCLPRTARGPRS